MKHDKSKNHPKCPREEIAAYVDGELSSAEELTLESHFAKCGLCRAEYDSQKRLLMDLDFVLEGEYESIPLPDDFARVVTANAESSIAGIRKPAERSRAVFFSVALFLLVTLSLGSEVGNVVLALQKIGDQCLAVAGFIFHLLYEIGVGLGIVLGCMGNRLIYGSMLTATLTLSLFILTSIAFSGLVYRFNRTP